MPKLVNSSQLIVHRILKTVNREPITVNCRPWRHGFTLIELLVVITIIGTLISVATIAFNNTLDKGRDSRRKNDLASIKSALALYFEQNGKYPPCASSPCTGEPEFASDTPGDWIPDLVPTYIKQLPKDPRQTALNLFNNLADLFKHQFTNQVYAAGIAFDEASQGFNTGGTSFTWQHSIGSGSNRLLVVGVSLWTGSATVSDVTYGDVHLTRIGTVAEGSSAVSELWYLGEYSIAYSATQVIKVTLSQGSDAVGGSTSWTGVNQSNPICTYAAKSGNSFNPSVDISCATGEVVVDNLATYIGGTLTPDDGQFQKYSPTNGSLRGAGSYKFAAGTTTMSWTRSTSERWAIIAASLQSATAPSPSPSPTPSPLPSPSPSPVVSGDCDNKQVYCYIALAGGKNYVLWAKLENTNDPEIYNKPSATCTDSSLPAGFNYCLRPD